MQKTKTLFLQFAVIICSLFLFTACTTSQNQTDKLKSNTILNKLATESAKPQTQPMKDYKELADFAPNPAQTATLVTNKGEITIKLFREDAPLTTANFLDLAANGFYNDIIFHRVIEDFMAQVGDPLTKDATAQARWGTGGPDYRIKDEFSPKLKHDQAGVVSMANSGPNTGGSQFFITHEATPWLDGKHAVFGQVTEGLDVLMSIEQGDKILSITLK